MDQLESIRMVTSRDTDWLAFQDELAAMERQTGVYDLTQMAAAPQWLRMTVTYGASRLLAVGADTLTGRKQLFVRNCGDVAVRVSGESSEAAIYENGIVIPPGVMQLFRFTPPSEGGDDVNLYVRSAGRACELEILEVK